MMKAEFMTCAMSTCIVLELINDSTQALGWFDD